jgi:hypothetical protein
MCQKKLDNTYSKGIYRFTNTKKLILGHLLRPGSGSEYWSGPRRPDPDRQHWCHILYLVTASCPLLITYCEKSDNFEAEEGGSYAPL